MARPKGKRILVVIAKGNKDVEGTMVKMNALNVVIKFIQMALPGTEVLSDKNMMLVQFKDNNKGDSKWVQDNVFKFVDILGTTNDDEADKKARKACDRYELQPHLDENGKELLGWGTLLYYLQQFYLIEKAASVFEVSK